MLILRVELAQNHNRNASDKKNMTIYCDNILAIVNAK